MRVYRTIGPLVDNCISETQQWLDLTLLHSSLAVIPCSIIVTIVNNICETASSISRASNLPLKITLWCSISLLTSSDVLTKCIEPFSGQVEAKVGPEHFIKGLLALQR